ncbi:MAG TPA: hypothetical protein VH643_26420 [Gemmataceae bacterium]|jgi:hypothetical protein
MGPPTILGLDLGQTQQFSALAAIREFEQDAHGRSVWAVPVLTRWPLGTPYPEIVSGVADIAGRLDQPVLVVDGTAVGRGTVDLFRQAELPVSEFVSVTVTAGHQAHRLTPEFWTTPKKDLVAAVQSVLQGRRLKVARGLREAATLTRELATFRAKTTTSASESLDDWREGRHDDLVLAVALAVWMGEFGPPPELNIVTFQLDPLSPGSWSAPQVVYPNVRYFPPYDSFQPLPQIDGAPLLACPDFKTQEQAAHFLVALHRKLGLPAPRFTVELTDNERSAVEGKVAEFVLQRQLRPATVAPDYTSPASGQESRLC